MSQRQIGLLQGLFDESIYPFTLEFTNTELESSYMAARKTMVMLTTSSKRFLMAVAIGFVIVILLDMGSALSFNTQYKYSSTMWIVYCTMFPALAAEAVCFCCDKFADFRGISITLVGCFVLFYNSSCVYYNVLFYPHIGIGYFFMS